MTTRTNLLFFILLSLVACQRPATSNGQQQDTDAQLSEEQIAMGLAEQEPRIILEGYIRSGQLPEGTWYDQNGSRICEGFLTRNIDEDFCAAEVPIDWVPFEFNGQTYYVQPLSATVK
jgi:hypothetical protein